MLNATLAVEHIEAGVRTWTKSAIYAILCQKLKIILKNLNQNDQERQAMATRNTLDAKERKRLITEIQSAGNQLIAHGINAKFVKGTDIPIEDLSLYDLCVALIDEAKRCTAQGIKCKFVCNAVSLQLATNIHNFRERRKDL